jgi:uridine kinase
MGALLKFKDEDGIEYDDLLNSDEILKKFHSLVMGSKYSVYAISGAWGTGKTCFIKMWENILYEEDLIFVHIDAFKMDYEVEPS